MKLEEMDICEIIKLAWDMKTYSQIKTQLKNKNKAKDILG